MGKIEWKNVLVGVGVGGVDEGLVYLDEKKGWTGIKTAVNIGRTAMVVLGAAGVLTGTMRKYAEPVLNAATPLFTKSVIQAIRSQVGSGATTARPRMMNIPMNRVSMRSGAIANAGPGFENVPSLY